MSDPANPVAERVFILFTGKTELPWLRWLRPGFRHCFALVARDRQWLLIDPLAGHLQIETLSVPSHVNVPDWYRDQGFAVIETIARKPGRQAPPALFTCVEAMKRLVGLHAPLILTPHQLYRHLSAAATTTIPARNQ